MIKIIRGIFKLLNGKGLCEIGGIAMPNLNNKRRYIYSLILVLIILILFSVISVTYVGKISNDLKDESKETIANQMEESRDLVDTEFQSDKAMVEFFSIMLAENPIYDFDDLKKFFYRYMIEVDRSNFARMSIILPDGTEYYMDGEISEVKDKECLQKNLRNQFTISAPYKDEYCGQKVVDFNAPIMVNGEVKGVVSAKKKIFLFEKQLASKFYHGNGFGLIINNSGEIIMSSLYQGLGNKYSAMNGYIDESSSDRPFIDDVRLGNQGIVTYTIDDERFITGYMPLENNQEWNLICMVPEHVVNDRAASIITSTVVVCIAVFILLFILLGYILLMRRKSFKEISKLAYIDNVTGIANINKFVKETEDIFSSSAKEEYAILQFDIDKFKYVNELFGYSTGNRLLKLVAEALLKYKRSGEVFARNTSDNFVIIMRYADDRDIIEKINNITEYVRNNSYNLIGKYDLHLPWGIYKISKDDPDDIYELLDRTLIAKSSIKHSYHDSYAVFSEDMRNRELREKEIENMMDYALENNEFVVYIQPKFDLKNSMLVGGEALIRWKQKTGMVSPGEFIPIFEKNGFVIKLDFYVLDKICQKVSEWIEEGLDIVPISVNQSRLHLREQNYIEKIVEAVEKYDIPKKYIEFELTEGMVCENPTEIKKVLDELQEYGFLTSIDDFGSGYSSLNMLSDLSVDVIKMDRGFLAMSSNIRNREIVVEQVISLAKHLNMKVLAEGVETEEQARFLRDNGCDIVQGFLYARPMPIIEFEKLLRQNSMVH